LVWGIESVQFQEFFRQILIAESAKRGIPVPARPLIPISDKDLRISSLSPHVANGVIRTHPRHTVLNDHLKHYPEADHVDGADALEMLWKLCLSGAGGVPRIRTGKRRLPGRTPSH
jgi:predicted phage terminase large subunit-like protein